MKLTDIVNQLKAVLPRYTNDFSTNLPIVSLIRSGSVVTATTSTSHGLIIGDKPLINGAKTPILISSLTRINNYALAICATKHNLTLANKTIEIFGSDQSGYNGNFELQWNPPTFLIESITIDALTKIAIVKTIKDNGFIADSDFEIKLSGSDNSVYNRTTTIASIVDSKTFTIANVDGVIENGSRAMGKSWEVRQVLNAYTFIYKLTTTPITPATGTIYQLYQYQTGYNGYKTVLSVPTATTFTYSIDSTPISPAQGSIAAKINPTITGAIDYERAEKLYLTGFETNQSSKWMIAVLSGSRANKNDKNKTDAQTYGIYGYQIREQSIQDITLYIFLPGGNISDELMYINTRDIAETYKPYIYKAILGFTPPSNLTENIYSQLMFVEDDYYKFENGFYVHYFKFQATNFINQEDAVDPADLSAFRTFDFDVLNEPEGEIVMEIEGEVDQAN